MHLNSKTIIVYLITYPE